MKLMQRVTLIPGLVLCFLAGLLILVSTIEAGDLPAGWESMEIEAKWNATETQFNEFVTAFPHGGTKYGFDLNVRWSGVPRMYEDRYFDNPTEDLFNALHMIRHRQRSSTSSSVAITDSFGSLGSTNWNSLNWQKVQYKSTPIRLAAVWFRTEQGDGKLSEAEVTATLAGNAPHPPYTSVDDPVALLLSDHSGFDFSTLQEVLHVIQYRYRVEFLDPITAQPRYELSLDKSVTTVSGESSLNSFSVELEVLRDTPLTEENVNHLFMLMQNIEEEFGIVPTTTSKGGVVVADSGTPEMRLEHSTLDYRQVELGFAFTKAIVVHNDGYAPLVVSVSSSDVFPPGELEHWPIPIDVTNVAVPIGEEPLILTQDYEPKAEGAHSIQFTVSGSDPVLPSAGVTLFGQGILPIPIDSVLVLDRSGSMNETAGERRKIDAMRDAVDLYAHLLRKNGGDSGTGDKLGFVKYNHADQIYLELDFVDDPNITGSHMEAAEEKLEDAALDDSARLLPQGATGIGGAMETAAGMLVGSSDDRKHVMVVLTDGLENQDPLINQVTGPIQMADDKLSMYSVGVGENIEPDKLQSITNAGDYGYHQISDNLSGVSLFELETFYFKIFSNATGMDLVVDPTVGVPIQGKQSIVVDTARVTSSDRKVTFLVLDSPILREFYDLEIVAPNGQVVGPGTTSGGIDVQHLQRYTYAIYKVILPTAEAHPEFFGNWILRLTSLGTWDPKKIKHSHDSRRMPLSFVAQNPEMGLAPVGFTAAVASNFHMESKVLPSNYLPGATVRLTAQMTDKGWPTPQGRIMVEVTTPDGNSSQVRLHDDGTHRDQVPQDATWTGEFINTGGSGSYRFRFRGQGRNSQGESVPREATHYVTLMRPTKKPTSGILKCISCSCTRRCQSIK